MLLEIGGYSDRD